MLRLLTGDNPFLQNSYIQLCSLDLIQQMRQKTLLQPIVQCKRCLRQ